MKNRHEGSLERVPLNCLPQVHWNGIFGGCHPYMRQSASRKALLCTRQSRRLYTHAYRVGYVHIPHVLTSVTCVYACTVAMQLLHASLGGHGQLWCPAARIAGDLAVYTTFRGNAGDDPIPGELTAMYIPTSLGLPMFLYSYPNFLLN